MKPGELKPTLGLLALAEARVLGPQVEDAVEQPAEPVGAVGELLGVLGADRVEVLGRARR